MDINRSTFYLHYTDIYQMLEKSRKKQWWISGKPWKAAPRTVQNGKNHSLPCPIFSILDSNRDLSLALLGPNGDMDFVERIETLIASKFLKPSSLPATDTEIRYAYAFCLSGCIGMIKTWLSRTEHESPEAMAELTYHLIDNTTQEYIQNYIW